jgi:putative transposase
MAKLLRHVQMRDSQYRHALERGSGHLCQTRYYPCAVEPERLGCVLRYVGLNPVRAGLVPAAGEYDWCNAAAHLGGANPWGSSRCRTGASAGRRKSGAPCSAAIREATYGGRPLGSREFVTR